MNRFLHGGLFSIWITGTCAASFTQFPNKNGVGGVVFQQANSIDVCRDRCANGSPFCYGFDWNFNVSPRCYLFYNQGYEQRSSAIGTSNYKRSPCIGMLDSSLLNGSELTKAIVRLQVKISHYRGWGNCVVNVKFRDCKFDVFWLSGYGLLFNFHFSASRIVP